MELQLPRGMRDFAPPQKLLRDRIIKTLVEVFERYGFSPLETPILERWEVLAAKYAGGEEILKETYRLRDQGGRELGLRYDLTTPLARFIGMNPNIKRPFKRYHIGQVYRDGPVRTGRYREFYQCDVDTVGARSTLADAEFILIALEVFEQLDFDIEIWVNHRQLLKGLAVEANVPDKWIDSGILSIDKLRKIGQEGVRAELVDKGIPSNSADEWLSHLDVSGAYEEIIDSIERAFTDDDRRRESGIYELQGFFDNLYAVLADDQREKVKFTPSLARGLGYYTGIIFEVYSLNPPLDSAVAAGGRYDTLIADFIGSEELTEEHRRSLYPAVGISFGLEPITELVEEREGGTGPRTVTQVYVIPIAAQREGLEIAQRLRRAGIRADLDLAVRGVSDNLKYANAYDIPYALLIGPEELKQDKVKLRDMRSGEEEMLTLDEAIAKLGGAA